MTDSCGHLSSSETLDLTDSQRYMAGVSAEAFVAPRRRPDLPIQHLSVSGSAMQVETPKPSRRDKWAYFLDRILAKRSGIFLLMFAWGLLQVTVFGMLYSSVWLFEGPGGGSGQCDDPRERRSVNRYIEGFWEAWTFMADPG
eukprot:CAMPEP_0115385392 /NCGR_PEP_ID=MMETSP0271-20121206/7605_1 /TAXON_ID=71861 /ORGANISM="Scrippsiella trochoidea, Strain CCMP3099" /LENGTH=141 /DNA_ID=CAMNT_0002808787 /DNA_START=63 /DNA_END=484 /DNA_ORIENTATION=+